MRCNFVVLSVMMMMMMMMMAMMKMERMKMLAMMRMRMMKRMKMMLKKLKREWTLVKKLVDIHLSCHWPNLVIFCVTFVIHSCSQRLVRMYICSLLRTLVFFLSINLERFVIATVL